jgi:hypothetical protein
MAYFGQATSEHKARDRSGRCPGARPAYDDPDLPPRYVPGTPALFFIDADDMQEAYMYIFIRFTRCLYVV